MQINVLSLLLLVKRWFRLFILVVPIGLIGYTILLFVPQKFKATAVIMPPAKASSMLSQFLKVGLKDIDIPSLNLDIEGMDDDILSLLLESVSLKKKIIGKYKLRSYYKMKTSTPIEKTLKAFDNDCRLYVSDENGFFISFTHKSPDTAALIANDLARFASEKYSDIQKDHLEEKIDFFNKMIEERKQLLGKDEDTLISFMKHHKIIDISEQARVQVALLSSLHSYTITQEIELKQVQNKLMDNNPVIDELKQRLKVLGSELESVLKADSISFLLNASEIPDLERQYLHLKRNVMIHNTILTFLIQASEQSYLQYRDEVPTIKFLEMATPPEKRIYPKRMITAGIAAFVFLLFFLAFAITMEILKTFYQKGAGLKKDIQELMSVLPGVLQRKFEKFVNS